MRSPDRRGGLVHHALSLYPKESANPCCWLVGQDVVATAVLPLLQPQQHPSHSESS